ncbi:MAG: hypothetical protein IPH11_15525 [Ignavibacteriales bacterium]|nr:hypothetical protein [Ignavibacteriales bacterium]
MNDYKLTFKLKQHTPLIHFQHDQHGATLRASELKPKLDKFILMKLGKEADKSLTENEAIYKKGLEEAKAKKWLVGKGEHPALEYKVRIEESNEVEYYLPLPLKVKENRSEKLVGFIKGQMNLDISILAPTPFFANADKIKFLRGKDELDEEMTKTEDLRFAFYANNEIEISIKTFKDGLKEKLEELIIPYFLMNNFGTRQNKGFGSFTVVEIESKAIKSDNKLLQSIFAYNSKNSYSDLNKLFQFIGDEYQLLKSGKNYPNYEKSELFKYFVDKNIRWEKRYIKQKINANRILNKELYWKNKSAPIDIEDKTKNEYNDWNDKQNNSYQYIRVLLGLAEQFEYTVFAEKKDNNGVWIKLTLPDSNKKYIVSLEHKPKPNEDKIERFQSPIFLKVIDGIVYLGIDDSYENILGEKFEFKLKFKGDNKGIIKSLGTLNVPNKFILSDFIQKHLSSNWKKIQ